MAERIELTGSVERVTYRNPLNNYSVVKMRVGDELISVVGNMVCREGELLRVEGFWQEHPRYGRQFKAGTCETLLPHTSRAIERYLGSGLIKGIGPVMAGKIIEKFGPETVRIIESDPGRLREVSGLGTKKIELIRKAFLEQKDLRETMLSLQEYEISPAYALRIYKNYGRECLQILKENPYRLAEDVAGIGFITADRIASKTGMPMDSPMRAEAGLLYLLERLAEEGHVFYPYGELLQEAEKRFDISRQNLLVGFAKIFEKNKIVLEENGDRPKGALAPAQDKAVYLARLHEAEAKTARRLAALCGTRTEKAPAFFVPAELPVKLSPGQMETVKRALAEKVLIITGGPGVGKTTVINAVLKIFEHGREAGPHREAGRGRASLAAPTGRAAKRLCELTGREAKTIHRLLEYSPREDTFKRNADNPLETEMVIVDEISMVDATLMAHLLEAVPDSSRLLLVGDADQLPSVGPGNVLKDMLASGVIPSVTLQEIFRQSEKSLITANAHRVNRGEFPEVPRGAGYDFYFFERETSEESLEKILELSGTVLAREFGLDPVYDVQVLTPMHRGTVGVSNLNKKLRELLNKDAQAGPFSSGDKVMQIKNDYEKDVFNGDTGVVKTVSAEGVTVDFDGRMVSYNHGETEGLQLAYAASVHKSQGSEYPAVIMPLATEHYLLLQRNLLYTAMTRARRLLVLVGSKRALWMAIKNNKNEHRYTSLTERLSRAFQEPYRLKTDL